MQHANDNKGDFPKAFSLNAYLFLLMGILGFVDIVLQITRGSFIWDYNVLGIGIFFGLRRYSRGWRTCALVLNWGVFCLIPLVFLWEISREGVAFFTNMQNVWIFLYMAASFSLALWQYRVLTRPDIRILFYDESNKESRHEQAC